jgi:hypothetical protein
MGSVWAPAQVTCGCALPQLESLQVVDLLLVLADLTGLAQCDRRTAALVEQLLAYQTILDSLQSVGQWTLGKEWLENLSSAPLGRQNGRALSLSIATVVDLPSAFVLGRLVVHVLVLYKLTKIYLGFGFKIERELFRWVKFFVHGNIWAKSCICLGR